MYNYFQSYNFFWMEQLLFKNIQTWEFYISYEIFNSTISFFICHKVFAHTCIMRFLYQQLDFYKTSVAHLRFSTETTNLCKECTWIYVFLFQPSFIHSEPAFSCLVILYHYCNCIELLHILCVASPQWNLVSYNLWCSFQSVCSLLDNS